ncbi:ribonucleoside-diphosphate reductase alpha chain [Novimethylophilus kurashikiensis]|uniref:Ribonucleoside-diphosphate reductase alpha chain n=1 Tax=Novimethylophilus kurashikiensis TaxID=1825523 RepID=A0A2R5F7P3_9PROT|nr:hypothetical protein [Novimethylophilus kurashikiensis]GBG14262.1 ribonucleoside-diphosphate reductase alpha chain [Novimethylophilus kurashikiensis]
MQVNATKSAIGKAMMSAFKMCDYTQEIHEDGLVRRETMSEAVDRVMAMHAEKYADRMTPELKDLMDEAAQAYKSRRVLGSQRSFQFGGPATVVNGEMKQSSLLKHEAKMYNCSVSYADRVRFFQETLYLLLCGCGVGFSVQKHHVAKLPEIAFRSISDVKVHVIADSIEGWADAAGVLLASYFTDGGEFREFHGHTVHFDYTQIRPKGAFIAGGFKAPGPDGLRASLQKVEELIERRLAGGETRLRTIDVYDIVMHLADAVLSGGVRRSATIAMFSIDDEDMLKAKTGNWFVDNPQRGRSNNSVMVERSKLTREKWAEIMTSVRDFGEPGFIFTEDLDFAYNPCVEIGMRPIAESGETGFQFCNLTEINGGKCDSEEAFYKACRAGAILGTLQAGYTNFKYLSDASRQITEREALLGVSITGWMNNPAILFDERILKKGAEIVKETNRVVAKLLGINPAARTTCAKPSGNASVLLGTASGIHGEHSARYFRHVQVNMESDAGRLIKDRNPDMVENSVWSTNGTDFVVAFPVETKEGSITKKDLLGVKQLEYVKKAQMHWVENGTNVELCVDKHLRHNISNTITVDDWAAVEQYLYDNRQWFAGVSLLAASGDKAYAQAPFTEVHTAEEILQMYGDASMFASGLIVDGLHAFDNNLWQATDTAMGFGLKLTDEARDLLRRDWVRRFEKFAQNFFDGNTQKASFCVKDVYNLHKWVRIQRTIEEVDFSTELGQKEFVDTGNLAGAACAGGVCELIF